jgi:hypothetical protein
MSSAGPLIVRAKILPHLDCKKSARSGRRFLAVVSFLWAQIEHLDASRSSFENLCGSNLPTHCQLGEQRQVSAMRADQDW